MWLSKIYGMIGRIIKLTKVYQGGICIMIGHYRNHWINQRNPLFIFIKVLTISLFKITSVRMFT